MEMGSAPSGDQAATPLVSLVIPSLNRARYLRATIDSALRQDYPAIECIVIDGGSTDGTLDILRSYGNKIHWVSEPDRGHADAINKGWRMSSGEILAWLNADDVWAPGAVRTAVEYLLAHPEVDVVYGNCGTIDAEGRPIGWSHLREWDLDYAVEWCDHCIPQPAAFLRRKAVEAVGWLDTSFFQKKDHDLWLRIGREGTIRHIPITLAYARDIPGISQLGRAAARACVEVTRRFFSRPRVPPRLWPKRARALSNSYLAGSQYAFLGGRHWDVILSSVIRAALADPSNLLRALSMFNDLAHLHLQAAPRGPRAWIGLAALAPLRVASLLLRPFRAERPRPTARPVVPASDAAPLVSIRRSDPCSS